jgi:hypothetical protein
MMEKINLNNEIDKSTFDYITKYINEIIEKDTTKDLIQEFLNSAAQENKNKGEN